MRSSEKSSARSDQPTAVAATGTGVERRRGPRMSAAAGTGDGRRRGNRGRAPMQAGMGAAACCGHGGMALRATA
jgi:hypothetical protein